MAKQEKSKAELYREERKARLQKPGFAFILILHKTIKNTCFRRRQGGRFNEKLY